MPASDLAQSVRSEDAGLAQRSERISAYSALLQHDPDSTLEGFLREHPTQDASCLGALVAMATRQRIAQGQASPLESYLEQFPVLRDDEEQLLDLIYAEYSARTRQSGPVDVGEYYRRYPRLERALARLFSVHSLLKASDPAEGSLKLTEVCLPEVGDTFADFRLVRVLGSGSFARVFLAEQISLSDRRVAVKITAKPTIEPQTLARLEHPNIVPVYSVHRDDPSGLTAVCMPYQHAVALSDVQGTWLAAGQPPSQAQALTDAVGMLLPSDLQPPEPQADAPRFPLRADFVHACAWLMHKLALALAHAHERGICHRDLKPSNILLTAEGQPLLVDFNLAFNEIESHGDRDAFFGGTLPYMPPEQIEALHPDEQGTAADVGPLADIYSLAATFWELLTGQFPFEAPAGGDRLAALRAQIELRHSALPSLHGLNATVPRDLAALLAKCLSPAPERRYESTQQLADDLARFLEDRPLRHIGKIPARESAGKFWRRNRRRLIAAAVVLTSLSSAGVYWRQHHEKLQTAEAALGKSAVQQRTLAQIVTTTRERLDESEAQRSEEKQKFDETITKKDVEVDEVKKKVLPDPTEAREYYARGVDLMTLGKYKQAIPEFTQALALDFEYKAETYFARGKCLAHEKNDRAAQADFTAAIKANDKHTYAYVARALTDVTSEEYVDCEQALEDAKQALKLAPDDQHVLLKNVHMDLARVYEEIWEKNRDPAHLDKAAELLKTAIEKGFAVGNIDKYRQLEKLKEHPKIKPLLAEKRN